MPNLGTVCESKHCNCCGWLSIDHFDTNPTTNLPYSRCRGCKLKPNTSNHAKRDAERAAKRALLKAKLESGELKKCDDCGPQPFAAFGTNSKTGELLSRCDPCNVKKLKRDTAYKKTDAGKAVEKRYKSGDAGKAAEKRYREGDAGQAASNRSSDHRTARRRESPAMRMDDTIMSASNCLISGRYQTSPTFVERTSFESAAGYLKVIEKTFAPGMTFANNGTVWEIDHKIPREAYDFDNPVDIKRCWSAKNVHAVTAAANKAKHWKLVDQYVAEAGVENFPVSWNGKFPDKDFKIAHDAKMTAHKIIEEEYMTEEDEMIEEDASNQPSGSNDFGPIETPVPDSDSDSD